MGRFTSDQYAAIAAGQPVRQTWSVRVPTSLAHSAYQETKFEDGLFVNGQGALHRVTRAGSRTHQVWNPGPQVQNTPTAVRYYFEASNKDGYFHPGAGSGTAWYSTTGSYQAHPKECLIVHQLFVLLLSGTWSEIEFLAFVGEVRELRFEVGRTAAGVLVPDTCGITVEQAGAWNVLRRPRTVEDGEDEPMECEVPGDSIYGTTAISWTATT